MKTNIRTLALLLGATLLGTILFTGTPAAAVNITNTVDEALLTSSNWNSSVWGTPAAEPLPTTNYFIGFGAASSGNIRTVSTTAAQSFNGAALQINNGKTLFLKHANGVATVSLLSGGGGPSTITYAGGASGTNCPLGGTLTLNNSLSIGSNQGANSVPIWVLSPISGTANLTVTTNATVVLFGTNRSYTGKWIINNGASLQIGSGTTNALGSGNVTNNSGGSLAFNSANNFTVTNLIVGAGSVIKQNTGTVTLTGASTFAGTVQVSGGVLQIGAGSSLATATNITLSGGTLDVGPVGGLSLAANETMNGCNGTVISNLTAATGNILNFNLSTPTNDVLNVTGSLTLSGTPTLNLNLSNNVPVGIYTLATYNTAGSSGAFNATPTILTGSVANPSTTTNFISTGNGVVNFNVLNTYTVNYNANTGSGTAPTDSNVYTNGATVTVPANTLAKTGYTFAGWYDAPSGGTLYTATQVGGTYAMPAANLTLYAQWTINNYTLTYTAAVGGSLTSNAVPNLNTVVQTVAYGSSGLAVLAVASNGYTFSAWSDGASNPRTDTAGVGGTNVTAKFTTNSYTLSYDGNTSTGGSTASSSVQYTTLATAAANGFTKTGYNFDHWNTAADNSGTTYNPSDTFTMPAANVTLYAQWVLACTAPVITGGISNAVAAYCVGNQAVLTLTNVSAGTPPLYYQWQTNGVNILNATNAAYTNSSVTVADGVWNYTVYVTNACGSVTSSVANLTVNTAASVTTDHTTATICFSSTETVNATNSGSATAGAWTVGTGNGAVVNSTNGNVVTGVYTPGTGDTTVVLNYTTSGQASPCGAAVATDTVTINAVPTITSVTPVNVTCNGSANGSITVSASISAGTMEYSKDNGSTWQSGNAFTGLAPGNYTIVVRNATVGGCQVSYGSNPVTITEPSALTVTGTATNNVTCNGSANGSFTVTPSGGSGAPYGYSINGGTSYQGSSTFSSLTAGTYNVTITNGAGCTASTSVTVTEPSALTVTGTATNNVTTHGGSNGSFTVTPSGGSGAPYGYSTNGGASYQGSGTFSSLTAGTYTVTITNGAGCTASTTVTVTEPSNSAPVASAVTVNRNVGVGIHISVRNILTNYVTDADSDPISLAGFTTPSYTNQASLTLVSNASSYFINYPATTNVDDRFDYWVTDGQGNYATNSVNIHVVDTTLTGTPITGQYTNNAAGGSFTVKYYGVIGYQYVVQRSTDFSSWVNLVTNTMVSPPVIYTDNNAPPTGPVFYRVAWKP